MLRNIAIASLAAAMLGVFPAHAQEIPELAGGPGSRAAEQDLVRQIAAQNKAVADRLKADQAKLAKQAEDLKAREARLEARAAELADEEKRLLQLRSEQESGQTKELKALEARLEARAAELAAEEKRLAQLRIDLTSEQAAKQVELIRQDNEEARREEPPALPQRTADRSVDAEGFPATRNGDAEEDALPETRRSPYARVDFETAERSCSRAAEDEALARNYYSARYDRAPRFYRGYGLELRGPMRLTDRRGYRLVDTVCELDADGEVQHFIFLR